MLTLAARGVKITDRRSIVHHRWWEGALQWACV